MVKDLKDLWKKLEGGGTRVSLDEKSITDFIKDLRKRNPKLIKFENSMYISQYYLIKAIGKRLADKGKHIIKRNELEDDDDEEYELYTDEVVHDVFEIIEDDYAIIATHYPITDTNIAFVFYNDYKLISEIIDGAFNASYEPGTFQLTKTTMGYVLVPIVSLEDDPPILKDGFENKISEDINKFFEKEQFFKDNKISYKRGILMYGPPGNGKTTCIKNILQRHKDKYCIIINCVEDFSSDIGTFFKKNLSNKNKIVIIEDLDGMGEYNRSAILNFIDGINSPEKMFLIATTNSIEKIDQALVERPSRFDRAYKIDVPDDESREKLILKFFPDVSGEELIEAIRKSKNFSGAYFKELYILSNLYDLSLIEAIENIQKNLNVYSKNKDVNYLG